LVGLLTFDEELHASRLGPNSDRAIGEARFCDQSVEIAF
jgi:hypothetical protein